VLDAVLCEQVFEVLRVGVDPGVVGHQALRGDAALGVTGAKVPHPIHWEVLRAACKQPSADTR
jgi:hypothetical protein